MIYSFPSTSAVSSLTDKLHALFGLMLRTPSFILVCNLAFSCLPFATCILVCNMCNLLLRVHMDCWQYFYITRNTQAGLSWQVKTHSWKTIEIHKAETENCAWVLWWCMHSREVHSSGGWKRGSRPCIETSPNLQFQHGQTFYFSFRSMKSVGLSEKHFHSDLWGWPVKKLCVLLCMPQNAPECARMRLRTPKIIKISWGSMPLDPPRMNNCGAAMFTTSPNDIPTTPPDRKSYVQPCMHSFTCLLSGYLYNQSTAEIW